MICIFYFDQLYCLYFFNVTGSVNDARILCVCVLCDHSSVGKTLAPHSQGHGFTPAAGHSGFFFSHTKIMPDSHQVSKDWSTTLVTQRLKNEFEGKGWKGRNGCISLSSHPQTILFILAWTDVWKEQPWTEPSGLDVCSEGSDDVSQHILPGQKREVRGTGIRIFKLRKVLEDSMVGIRTRAYVYRISQEYHIYIPNMSNMLYVYFNIPP